MSGKEKNYEENARLWEYWNGVLSNLLLHVLPAEVRSRDPIMDAIAVAYRYAMMNPDRNVEEYEKQMCQGLINDVKMLRKMAFWILIQEDRVKVISRFKGISTQSYRRSLRDYYYDTQKIEILEYHKIYKSDLFHLMAIATMLPLNIFVYFPMAQGNLKYAYLNVWPLFRKNHNVISVNSVPRVDTDTLINFGKEMLVEESGGNNNIKTNINGIPLVYKWNGEVFEGFVRKQIFKRQEDRDNQFEGTYIVMEDFEDFIDKWVNDNWDDLDNSKGVFNHANNPDCNLTGGWDYFRPMFSPEVLETRKKICLSEGGFTWNAGDLFDGTRHFNMKRVRHSYPVLEHQRMNRYYFHMENYKHRSIHTKTKEELEAYHNKVKNKFNSDQKEFKDKPSNYFINKNKDPSYKRKKLKFHTSKDLYKYKKFYSSDEVNRDILKGAIEKLKDRRLKIKSIFKNEKKQQVEGPTNVKEDSPLDNEAEEEEMLAELDKLSTVPIFGDSNYKKDNSVIEEKKDLEALKQEKEAKELEEQISKKGDSKELLSEVKKLVGLDNNEILKLMPTQTDEVELLIKEYEGKKGKDLSVEQQNKFLRAELNKNISLNKYFKSINTKISTLENWVRLDTKYRSNLVKKFNDSKVQILNLQVQNDSLESMVDNLNNQLNHWKVSDNQNIQIVEKYVPKVEFKDSKETLDELKKSKRRISKMTKKINFIYNKCRFRNRHFTGDSDEDDWEKDLKAPEALSKYTRRPLVIPIKFQGSLTNLNNRNNSNHNNNKVKPRKEVKMSKLRKEKVVKKSTKEKKIDESILDRKSTRKRKPNVILLDSDSEEEFKISTSSSKKIKVDNKVNIEVERKKKKDDKDSGKGLEEILSLDVILNNNQKLQELVDKKEKGVIDIVNQHFDKKKDEDGEKKDKLSQPIDKVNNDGLVKEVKIKKNKKVIKRKEVKKKVVKKITTSKNININKEVKDSKVIKPKKDKVMKNNDEVKVGSTTSSDRKILPTCPPTLIPDILADPESISKGFSGEEMKLAKIWTKKSFNVISNAYRCPCCGKILKVESQFIKNHWTKLRQGLSCGFKSK